MCENLQCLFYILHISTKNFPPQNFVHLMFWLVLFLFWFFKFVWCEISWIWKFCWIDHCPSYNLVTFLPLLFLLCYHIQIGHSSSEADIRNLTFFLIQPVQTEFLSSVSKNWFQYYVPYKMAEQVALIFLCVQKTSFCNLIHFNFFWEREKEGVCDVRVWKVKEVS